MIIDSFTHDHLIKVISAAVEIIHVLLVTNYVLMGTHDLLPF